MKADVATAGRLARRLHTLKTSRPICLNCSALLSGLQPQRRHYAKPRAAPRAAPSSQLKALKKDTERLIFSLADVPPLEFWTRAVELWDVQGLTARDCWDGAKRYVLVATQWESAWRPKLESEHGLSPYKLHYIGSMLIHGDVSERWKLGMHVLHSASELGYTPSTLNLARLMSTVAAKNPKAVNSSLLFQKADARFKDIVRRGRDPNALTLQGLIYAGRKQDVAALTAFDNAAKAGASRGWLKPQQPETPSEDKKTTGSKGESNGEPMAPAVRPKRWDWEPSCVLGRGRILLKQGRREEAEAAFRSAALELDNAEGYLSLAQLLPKDAPQREEYLIKAAISGVTEACGLLADIERVKADRPDMDREQARVHDRLSREWSNLAGRTTEAAAAPSL